MPGAKRPAASQAAAAKSSAKKTKLAAGVVVAENLGPAADEITDPAVAAHVARVHAALNDILENPIFADVATASPLKIAEGAVQAHFW